MVLPANVAHAHGVPVSALVPIQADEIVRPWAVLCMDRGDGTCKGNLTNKANRQNSGLIFLYIVMVAGFS